MSELIQYRPDFKGASGRRTEWQKVVRSINEGTNGYALTGDFLNNGVLVELPENTVIISVKPKGSVKNGWKEAEILLLKQNGVTESIMKADWRKDFILIRNKLNELLT